MSIANELKPFVSNAQQTFGPDLLSVTLYGSGAEGRLRKTSDINLIFVLARFETKSIEAFAAKFAFARATQLVNVMWILESEIPIAVEAFAQKFSDVKRRHQVLFGHDYFSEQAPSRQAIVFRLGQVLLNAQLRLRDALALHIQQPDRLAQAIAHFTSPVRTSAATVRELRGEPTLAPKEALEQFLEGKAADLGWLRSISLAREGGALSPQAAVEAVEGLIYVAGLLRDELKQV